MGEGQTGREAIPLLESERWGQSPNLNKAKAARICGSSLGFHTYNVSAPFAAGARDSRALGPGLGSLRHGAQQKGPGLPSATPPRGLRRWSPWLRARLARPSRERRGAAAQVCPDAVVRCAGQLHRQLLLVPGTSQSPLVTTCQRLPFR